MDPPPKTSISQKEYLKKYFSKSKSEKSKKKKVKLSSSSHLKRSQIIDDDLNLNSLASIDDEEFNLEYLGDEAPQVAGIVDERPEHIKAMEIYGDSKKWKSLQEDYDSNTSLKSNLSNDSLQKRVLTKGEGLTEGKIIQRERDNGSSLHKKSKTNSHKNDLSKLSSEGTAGNRNQNNSGRCYPDRSSIKSDSREQDIKKYVNELSSDHESDQSPSRKTSEREKPHRRGSDSDHSPPRKASGREKPHRRDSDSDQSPPRNTSGREKLHRRDFDNDLSPPRKTSGKDKLHRRDSDSDQTPPRKTSGRDKLHRRDSDGDQPPPRKTSGRDKLHRRDSDSDQSPPRKTSGREKLHRRDSDSDQSPPRMTSGREKLHRRDSDSDQSPPRKTYGRDKLHRRGFDSDLYPTRKTSGRQKLHRRGSDSDQSPPRKTSVRDKLHGRGFDNDLYPTRKTSGREKLHRRGSDSDQSPPRKASGREKPHRRGSDSEQSPPRKTSGREMLHKRDPDSDLSPPRKSSGKDNIHGRGSDSDLSPPRKASGRDKPNMNRSNNRKIRDLDKQQRNEKFNNYEQKVYDKNYKSKFDSVKKLEASKLKKDSSGSERTLEGKKAGLQDAKNLRAEMASLKEQEERLFKNMDSSKYGFGSEAVVRDRKTGRIKDFVKEQEESEEKMRERLAREEKYSKWGKGLKQLEDERTKVAGTLYEMSKPLARYKDDEDLDTFLKAQEREGDPMLDYIRKKQSESHPVEKLKPRYEGSFGPNRFNIRPGHRWDGVDRSNGYEAKWFESINAKKALQEEAYKWSSADM